MNDIWEFIFQTLIIIDGSNQYNIERTTQRGLEYLCVEKININQLLTKCKK